MTDHKYLKKYFFIAIILFFLWPPILAVGRTLSSDGTPKTIAPKKGVLHPTTDPTSRPMPKQLKEAINLSEAVLEAANKTFTNSGLQNLVVNIVEENHNALKMVAQQKFPDGSPIPAKVFEKIITGFSDNSKNGAQLVEVGKKLVADNKIIANRIWLLNKGATLTGPAAKVLGFLSEDDVDGAAWKTVDQGCKWGTVTVATVIVAGSNPVGWGVVAAAGAAFATATAYDHFISPIIDKYAVYRGYISFRKKTLGKKIEKLCSRIKSPHDRDRFRFLLESYIDTNISEQKFRRGIEPFKKEISQAIQEEKSKRQKIVSKLRNLETKQPHLKPLIDDFEKGRLLAQGQARLLLALQREVGQCNEKLSTEHVRASLSRLSHKKVLKVFKTVGLEVPKSFYDCLCGAYSHPGVGYSYTPNGKCGNFPCQGGNWGISCMPFPKFQHAWDNCMASNFMFVKKDQNGKILDPGIRIDEYIAGKRILQAIAKE